MRLLTDEHISPKVSAAAAKLCELEIVAMRDWRRGHMLSASDELVLEEARRDGLTSVTFDLRTIPSLLRAWGEQSIDHAGVILVDDQTLPPTDIGRLAQALCDVWLQQRAADWTNRVVFLRRS